jgi:hypothetical protein
MHTEYSFLAGNYATKIWAKGHLLDPAPKVPLKFSDEYQPGDYVLLRGCDLTIFDQGRNACEASFEPSEQLVLKEDWTEFDQDMTGHDLVDLGDVPFLLWWQNIQPPKKKIPKKVPEKKKKNTRR